MTEKQLKTFQRTLQRLRDVVLTLAAIAPDGMIEEEIKIAVGLPNSLAGRKAVQYTLKKLTTKKLLHRRIREVEYKNRYQSHTQQVWEYYVPIN